MLSWTGDVVSGGMATSYIVAALNKIADCQQKLLCSRKRKEKRDALLQVMKDTRNGQLGLAIAFPKRCPQGAQIALCSIWNSQPEAAFFRLGSRGIERDLR